MLGLVKPELKIFSEILVEIFIFLLLLIYGRGPILVFQVP